MRKTYSSPDQVSIKYPRTVYPEKNIIYKFEYETRGRKPNKTYKKKHKPKVIKNIRSFSNMGIGDSFMFPKEAKERIINVANQYKDLHPKFDYDIIKFSERLCSLIRI
jgi:hypothetical protein